MATRPQPMSPASIQRSREVLSDQMRALAIEVQVRIAGASIRNARASERSHTRQ